MVELLYPEYSREFPEEFRRIPYLVSVTGDYLEGVNHYLQERLSGRLDAYGAVRTVFCEVSDDLIKSVSYNLLDAMNWVEWVERNVPNTKIDALTVQPWHFRYLYATSMLRGFWSQEFWASGNPTPLNPSRTIKPRVREVVACYEFMAKEALIRRWEDAPDGIEVWGTAWRTLEIAFLSALPVELRQPRDRVYAKRKSPGRASPPLPQHLKVYFRCFDDEMCFRAARLIFTAGLRIEEVVTQTLIPGTMHQRQRTETGLHTIFPAQPYLLKHDPRDDRMIGVMPSIEIAFADDEAACAYRIVGKGPKVRSVPVPPAEMRALWKCRDRRCPISEHGPSQFFLNKRNQPLSTATLSRALSVASRRASAILGTELNLTAHFLRHAFACRFMEAAIIGQAQQTGLSLSSLTPDQIDKFGRGPLITLQDILGHEWSETTELYLKQLRRGILAFQYTKMFNQQLDDVEWDDEHTR